MLREQRLQFIRDLVSREKIVIIAELSKSFNVSYMTIWRDLKILEEDGVVERVRGGAVSSRTDDSLDLLSYPHLYPQLDEYYECKLHIARYAADTLINPGDNVIIEAGTTATGVLRHMDDKDNITVLTNGLATSLVAAKYLKEKTVMCSGGVLIETGAFIGPQAEEFFSNFSVNSVFLGAQGLTVEDDFTDLTPLYIQLKKAMKKNAEKTIMLVDSSKWGTRSLIKVMALDEVDIVVTDRDAPGSMVEILRKRGVDVRIAGDQL